jgi:hypothetical protein
VKSFQIIAFLCLILFPSNGSSEINPKTTRLSEHEKGLVDWVHSQQAAMLHDLKTYVNINTGTFNYDGINKFRNMLEVQFKSIGFETSLQPGGEIDLLTCQRSKMVFADIFLPGVPAANPRRCFSTVIWTPYSRKMTNFRP